MLRDNRTHLWCKREANEDAKCVASWSRGLRVAAMTDAATAAADAQAGLTDGSRCRLAKAPDGGLI